MLFIMIYMFYKTAYNNVNIDKWCYVVYIYIDIYKVFIIAQ